MTEILMKSSIALIKVGILFLPQQHLVGEVEDFANYAWFVDWS